MDPKDPQVTTQDIQSHPAFAELREKYEWNESKEAFPKTLKSGQPNPLFGVKGVMVVIPVR